MNDVLQQALLSLDAYNRGAAAKLNMESSRIAGYDVVFNSAQDADAGYNPNFSATTYLKHDGTEVLISYRGTDDPSDVPTGWISGGGLPSAQATDAISYYRSEIRTLYGDDGLGAGPAVVNLTGHSLGGALAGIVASLYGNEAKVFNNEPFEEAANTYYDMIQDPDASPAASYLRNLVLGDAPLGALHTGVVTTYTNIHDVLWPIRIRQASSQEFFEAGSAPVFSALGHSMSFQVALIYADANKLVDWVPASGYLWSSFNSSSLAASIAGVNDLRGAGSQLDVMQHAIAYSAVDTTMDAADKPFGDTGMRSMFDDIGDMKGAVQPGAISGGVENSALHDGAQALADLAVFYAGSLAINRVLASAHADAANGIISTGQSTTLAVDLTAKTWFFSDSGAPADLKQSLVESSFGSGPNAADRISDLRSALASYDSGQFVRDGGGDGGVYQGVQSVRYQTIGKSFGSGDVALEGRAIDIGFLADAKFSVDTTPQGTDTVRAIVASNDGQMIVGHAEDDIFVGGNGSDRLDGGAGRNVLFGGDGVDLITSRGTGDVVDGGAKTDRITVLGSSAIVSGGTGNDVIDVRNASGTTIVFGKGDGRDYVLSGGNHDFTIQLEGFSSSDVRYVFSKQSTFDNFQVGTGYPIQEFGGAVSVKGTLSIVSKVSGDSITIDDVVTTASYWDGVQMGQKWYYSGNRASLFDFHTEGLRVSFANGQTIEMPPDQPVIMMSMFGELGELPMFPVPGDAPPAPESDLGDVSDFVVALQELEEAINAAKSSEKATAGDDTFFGGIGDDVLEGGAGDDTFSTIGGNDRFDGGSGKDVVRLLGSREQFDVSISGDAIVVTDITGTEGSVTMTSVEEIHFGAGSIVPVITIGTADADTISVSSNFAIVNGAEGDDVIVGSGHNLALFGGAGDDRITGGDGDDQIEGGIGDDDLAGGAGSDVYVWRLGDGSDVVVDERNGEESNMLRLVAIKTALVDLVRDGDDLLIEMAGSGETIRLVGQLRENGVGGVDVIAFADGYWGRDALLAKLNAEVVEGTAGDDQLSSMSIGSTFHGGAGKDMIQSTPGEDVYLWNVGDGDDVVRASQGWFLGDQLVKLGEGIGTGDVKVTFTEPSSPWDDDSGILLEFASGGSLLLEGLTASSSRALSVRFDDGTLLTKEALIALAEITPTTRTGTAEGDYLYGTARANKLVGGLGDDYLAGRGGSDVYEYASGDGNDVISDEATIAEDNVLRLADLLRSDVSVARGDYYRGALSPLARDMILTDLKTGQTISIVAQFGEVANDEGRNISTIEFADGSRYDFRQIAADVSNIHGTAASERYSLNWGGWIVDAGGGDDLIGVNGTSGGTIVFGSGDGHDRLQSNMLGSGYERHDTLALRDLLAGDVELTRDGAALVVTIIATGETFTASHQWNSYGESAGLERITFADGTSWDRAGMADHLYVPDVFGTDGDDHLFGTVSSERVVGGRGDDTITESGGVDTYVWNLGDGHDVIAGSGQYADGGNVIAFGDGITVGDVSIRYVGPGDNDVLLDLGNGQGVELRYLLGNGSARSLEVKFQDGTVLTRADVLSAADANPSLIRMEGDDESRGVYGTRHADLIIGNRGDDQLVGGWGSDVYEYRSGDGNDQIYDDTGPGTDVNSIVFADLDHDEVEFARGGYGDYDLLLTDMKTGGTIKVANQFFQDYIGIDRISFEDGVVYDRSDLIELVQSPSMSQESFGV